jgi:hypothetical protein
VILKIFEDEKSKLAMPRGSWERDDIADVLDAGDEHE